MEGRRRQRSKHSIQKAYQTVKNNVLSVDKHQIPFSEKSLSKNVCESLFVT